MVWPDSIRFPLARTALPDPLVILGTASVVTVATLAWWVPAWRAARFDPISSVRND